jgi:hypothetical protein
MTDAVPPVSPLDLSMTEHEWASCQNPDEMRDCLEKLGLSTRKLRLFACACCRSVGPLITLQSGWKALEVAELFADGLADEAELLRAGAEANKRVQQAADGVYSNRLSADYAAAEAAAEEALSAAIFASSHACGIPSQTLVQCSLLRCIRPQGGITLDPACLRWRNGTIAKLAQAAYDERQLPAGHLDAVRLAVLADALEECGSGDMLMITHLRCPEPHVRGCWPLDLLLGKS